MYVRKKYEMMLVWLPRKHSINIAITITIYSLLEHSQGRKTNIKKILESSPAKDS